MYRILIRGLFLTIFIAACGWTQTGEEARWKEFQSRLEAVEKRLGIAPSSLEPKDMDRLFERLEKLEKAVYKDEVPPTQPTLETTAEGEKEMVAPPPQSSADLEWQEWSGDEETAEEVQRRQTRNDVSDYLDSVTSPYDLMINGYGYIGFVYDEQRDISSFRANAFELDFTKRINDWAVFGADLIYINEGLDPVFPAFRHSAYGTGGSSGGGYGASGAGNDDDDDLFIEQLFVRFRPMSDLEITAGKFNVPTGLERRTPDLRYNVSPSLLFPLWPRDLTGVMATYQVTDNWSISPYIFNGWDLDENNNNSFIYALYNQVKVTEDFSTAATVAYGTPWPDNDEDEALLLDFELRYTGIQDLLAAVEYMYVVTEAKHQYHYKGRDSEAYHGVLAMGHYDFSELFGLTLQSSYVRDLDGFLYGSDQSRWEFSIIPALYLAQGLELRLQYQHLESDDVIMFLQRNPQNHSYSKSDDLFILSALWSF